MAFVAPINLHCLIQIQVYRSIYLLYFSISWFLQFSMSIHLFNSSSIFFDLSTYSYLFIYLSTICVSMNINPSIQLATSIFYIALFALDSDVRINVSYSFFTVYSVSYSCFRVGNTIATVKKSPWSITKKSDSFGIYLNQLCKYVFLFGLQWHHSICSWRHRKNNKNGEKACPTLLCPIATACGIFTGAVATQCRDLIIYVNIRHQHFPAPIF